MKKTLTVAFCTVAVPCIAHAHVAAHGPEPSSSAMLTVLAVIMCTAGAYAGYEKSAR
jgi:hypothetical protein